MVRRQAPMPYYTPGKAKRTVYKDIWFRATLEAKWAVFFDALSIKWQYEPFYSDVDFHGGLTGYKIDFFLEEIGVFVEVKPFRRSKFPSGVEGKARGWAKEYGDVLILIGPPAVLRPNTKSHFLIEYSNDRRFRLYEQMWWCRCPMCGKVDITPEGGVPADCRRTCFSNGPDTDLFGEFLDDPPGHLDPKIKEACKIANNYFKRP